MKEIKKKYTPAQADAIKKYLSNKAKDQIRMPLFFKDRLFDAAKNANMSVNAYILEAIEEKNENVKDEIPSELLPNLIEWLKEHGHSAEEIVDCLSHLGNNVD